MLNIVDDYTRECLAIEVDTSLGGVRVARILEELKQKHRLPRQIPQSTDGVREPCRRPMGLRAGPAIVHDPTRTTAGKRLCRKLQWTLS
jgi:hypothetical protein